MNNEQWTMKGEEMDAGKKPRSKKGLIIAAIIVAGFVCFGLKIWTYDPNMVHSVRVSEGYDAVRFELVNNKVVSLIGVAMPPVGTRNTARNVVAELIEGKSIRIEDDKQERLLSYVYVKVKGGQEGLDELLGRMGLAKGKVKVSSDGEVFINEMLVRLGLAESKPEAPNLKYAEKLDAAQREAKKEGLGLWAAQQKTEGGK